MKSCQKSGLTLAELELLTRARLTVLLTLNSTSITGNKARSLQCATKGRIVFHQCTGNAVTNGTRLTCQTATLNVDEDVEGLLVLGEL